jgi:hypothetical protein
MSQRNVAMAELLVVGFKKDMYRAEHDGHDTAGNSSR